MKDKIDATGLFVWEGKIEGYRGDDLLVTTERNSANDALVKLKRAGRRMGYPKPRVTNAALIGTIDA
jgi:hypothetical protein